MRKNTKSGLIRFFCTQMFVVFLAAAIFFIVRGWQAFVSALLGGMVTVIPGFVFSIKLFKYRGAQYSKEILNGFYTGAAYKIILSGALFALIFMNYEVDALAFFVTLILAQAIYWFAPLLIVTKRKRRKSS